MKVGSRKLPNLMLALAVVGLGALVIGPHSVGQVQARSSAPAGLKTVRWYGLAGTATWAATLDPALVEDSISYNVMNQVYSNLEALMPSGAVVPTPGHPANCWEKVGGKCKSEDVSLATKVKVSKNLKTFTFTMRKGLKFANGDKLNAEDVKYSITRALLKSTASPYVMLYDGGILGASAVNSGKTGNLKGVKVLSGTKLKITTAQTIAGYFLKTLSYPTADVVDPKVTKGKTAASKNNYLTNTCKSAGSGQFTYKCINHGFHTNKSGFYPTGQTPTLTLVPNKHFYGPKPHVKLVMKAIADCQTNFADYNSGGIDTSCIPTNQIKNERHSPSFLEFPTSVVDYATMNEHPDSPFHNIHCRLAIDYGINRNAINNKVLHGAQKSTYQVLPGNIKPYYYKPWAKSASARAKDGIPDYNKAKAKSELLQCPQLHNYSLTIMYQHTSTDVDNEYKAVSSMLNSIIPGYMNVQIKGLTFNDWLGVVGSPKGLDSTPQGKVDMTENLWIEDYPDPEDYDHNLLYPGSVYNIGYFNNAKFKSLIDKGDTSVNQNTRQKAYHAAEKIALRLGAWVSVGNALGFALVKTNVHGLQGSGAYGELVPRGDLWAHVSVS